MLWITARVKVDTKEKLMSVEQRSADNAAGPAPKGSGLKKIVAASMVGTVVEWYEFFLYATAATLVFGKYFFPATGNELDGIIQAFITYAVGFVARPLGGIVFGQIGDKLGRKPTLQLTIVIVGVATFLMGCLPGFADIGYLAPALLVALRFIQGFALGGEWGGAVLLVAEHSPNKSRGFWSSWPQAAVPVGNLLATLVLYVMSSTLSPEAFLGWGWRVAFWLSAVIVFVGYYIRTHVSEAPIFLEAKALVEKEQAVSYGVFEVVRKYPKGILQAMGLRFAENIMYYLVVSFAIVYLKSVHKYDTSSLLLALLIAHVIHFLVIPQVGRLVDSCGPQARLPLRCHLRCRLAVLRLPHVRYPERRGHRPRRHHRPVPARLHVRRSAGHHGRALPHPDAVLGCFPGLAGHVHLRRFAGAAAGYPVAQGHRLLGPHGASTW